MADLLHFLGSSEPVVCLQTTWYCAGIGLLIPSVVIRRVLIPAPQTWQPRLRRSFPMLPFRPVSNRRAGDSEPLADFREANVREAVLRGETAHRRGPDLLVEHDDCPPPCLHPNQIIDASDAARAPNPQSRPLTQAPRHNRFRLRLAPYGLKGSGFVRRRTLRVC